MNSIVLVFYYCIGKKQHILASLRKAEQNIFVPPGLARGFLKSFPKKNVYFPEVLYIYRQRPDSDVKQNSIYRKMLLARIKTLPHAFSTRTELVATAALVAASVDYFKRYEELPPLDLHVHKQEAITACNDGHLRKRTLKRFLLICDHPRLARFYLTQRRIVNVAMFWKRH